MMTVMPPHSARSSDVGSRPRRGSSKRTERHVGPVAVTPFRIILGVVFVGALGYIAWAIVNVDDSAQIPMVTSGMAVLGLAFTALSAAGALRMWQASRANAQGQAVLFALLGGIAGMAALGCFAGTLVLSLVWGA